MTRPFERVHTMTDYFDGPRGGIASFDGRPHWYESRFDDVKDELSDVYEADGGRGRWLEVQWTPIREERER